MESDRCRGSRSPRRVLATLSINFALAVSAPSALGAATPSDVALTGRDIYQRVLDNRFDSYVQLSFLRSGDRAGHDQESRFRMWFKNFRAEERANGVSGVRSKTLVKYLEPFDLRHSGYLVIHKSKPPSDQFVYLSSRRRVQRINLRGEALFGTDFSFEDIVPREIEDASYQRGADAEIEGVPCFLVAARPTASAESEYSRFDLFVEKARSVPLRIRYWDEIGVEVKELVVDHASIERIDDVWVPMRMTMKNLREDSFTELVVREIEPNARLRKTTFDLRRLESH